MCALIKKKMSVVAVDVVVVSKLSSVVTIAISTLVTVDDVLGSARAQTGLVSTAERGEAIFLTKFNILLLSTQ
jgi:hypothetical protein